MGFGSRTGPCRDFPPRNIKSLPTSIEFICSFRGKVKEKCDAGLAASGGRRVQIVTVLQNSPSIFQQITEYELSKSVQFLGLVQSVTDFYERRACFEMAVCSEKQTFLHVDTLRFEINLSFSLARCLNALDSRLIKSKLFPRGRKQEHPDQTDEKSSEFCT